MGCKQHDYIHGILIFETQVEYAVSSLEVRLEAGEYCTYAVMRCDILGPKLAEKKRRDTRIFLRAFRALWFLTYNSFQKQERYIWATSSKQTFMRS